MQPRRHMKVKDVMRTYALVSAEPRDTVEIASQLMLWADVVHLPVVDRGHRVIGVLSARDLVGAARQSDPIEGYMTSPAITVSPEDDVADVATTLVARRIGCAPVVEDGALVGILTTGDLVAHQVARMLHPGVEPSPTLEGFVGRPLATVHPGDDLLEAVTRMASGGVRHLPVVDGDGRLTGMVSDRDVRAAVGSPMLALERGPARARVRALKVADVMSRGPVSVPPSATLEEVARILVERRVGAVPIVDDEGRPVGLISYIDALRAVLEG
jgi:CBS domain-containing protein